MGPGGSGDGPGDPNAGSDREDPRDRGLRLDHRAPVPVDRPSRLENDERLPEESERRLGRAGYHRHRRPRGRSRTAENRRMAQSQGIAQDQARKLG